jgi:hypothetical protein
MSQTPLGPSSKHDEDDTTSSLQATKPRGEPRGERMSIWPPFPRPDTNGLATAVNKRGVERVRRVDSGERDGKVVQNGRGRRWWEWYVWMEKDENADET